MISYKTIIKDILDDLMRGKYQVDDKLPSENQLAIKYNVSRAMINRVFSELEKIGAIYSRPKKGFFAAKYFNGLIKSFSFEYLTDKITVKEEEPFITDFLNEEFNHPANKLSFVSKEYHRGDKLIIRAHIWATKYLAEKMGKIDETNAVMDMYEVESAMIIQKFEKFSKGDKNTSLVNYKIFYTANEIPMIIKYTVAEDEFKMTKKEHTYKY